MEKITDQFMDMTVNKFIYPNEYIISRVYATDSTYKTDVGNAFTGIVDLLGSTFSMFSSKGAKGSYIIVITDKRFLVIHLRDKWSEENLDIDRVQILEHNRLSNIWIDDGQFNYDINFHDYYGKDYNFLVPKRSIAANLSKQECNSNIFYCYIKDFKKYYGK